MKHNNNLIFTYELLKLMSLYLVIIINKNIIIYIKLIFIFIIYEIQIEK